MYMACEDFKKLKLKCPVCKETIFLPDKTDKRWKEHLKYWKQPLSLTFKCWNCQATTGIDFSKE